MREASDYHLELGAGRNSWVSFSCLVRDVYQVPHVGQPCYPHLPDLVDQTGHACHVFMFFTHLRRADHPCTMERAVCSLKCLVLVVHTLSICLSLIQVLGLYEAEVLDSIQFLFDLGFVPRVALPFHGAHDRKAVVEAVRGHMGSNGKGGGLRLESWPEGSHSPAPAPAALMEGVKPDAEEAEGATSMGLRILSTSRYAAQRHSA